MSRIPKLPTMATKENRPGLSNRVESRTLARGLSENDKKSLMSNHTRPLRKTVTTSMSNVSNHVMPAPRLKRALTAPTTSNEPPIKAAKVETKTPAVRKFAPYDYKGKYLDLLERFKIMKSEFMDLKEKHGEVTEDYDKVKDAVESCNNERDTLKEKLLKTLSDMKERSAQLDQLKLDYDIQKHEVEELHRKTGLLESVTESFKQKAADFDKLQSDFDVLNRRYNSLKEEAEALRVLSDHLKKMSIEHEKLQLDYEETKVILSKNMSDSESLQNILASMYKDQRDLRNTVQDLKGNIRVYCRVRPPLKSEETKPLFNLTVLDSCSIEVEKTELSMKKGKHSFTFDGIFTPLSSQEDIFTEVSAMVQSALDGYNVCIFAYGQTGSGKTYTMEGGCSIEQYGIIPRAFNMIFTKMEDLKKMGWELNIKASFLEIYNEIIYDLLNPSNRAKDQKDHEIKMVDSKGSDVYVTNLIENEVKSSHDFIKMMIYAQRNRQTAATINNERSSRSHSVAQIKISATHEKRKEIFTSHLNLVDLAGSESGKTTQRMDETKHINRSLSELSKVILSLQTNQAHIPYRNSKLTHLLMPSLGGNSKTLMLVNINQFDECFSETLNSLRFATKVNTCRTIKAKKNLTMIGT